MKKQIIVLSVIFLMFLLVCGCTEEDTNDDGSSSESSDGFVGSWYGWKSFPDFYEIWFFYENNSLKIDDTYSVEWGSYQIDGDEIVVSTPFGVSGDEYMDYSYYYSFTEDDKNLTLTNVNFDDDVIYLYKEGYQGERYQSISDFVGSWSNQTVHLNYSNGSDWVKYRNYTFYSNFSVKSESNYYFSEGETWQVNWFDFVVTKPGVLNMGTMTSDYSFSDNSNVLNYKGRVYQKV